MANEHLQTRLAEVDHYRIKLSAGIGENPHRPDFSLWAAADDDGPPHVVLVLSTMWGQPMRCAELVPDEARALARELTRLADLLDLEVAQAAAQGPALMPDQRVGSGDVGVE